tara:strand:+ start:158 stop:655 length:498 start_codon:yes stop_codon:yes gene_type:complete
MTIPIKTAAIYFYLQQLRLKLSKMSIAKSGYNDFSKYKYSELKDFMPKVNELCDEFGIVGVITFNGDNATLTLVSTVDNTSVVFTTPVVFSDMKGANKIQNLGATHTYLRRYLWTLALELTENDEVESAVKTNQTVKTNQKLEAAAQKVSALKKEENYNWQSNEN